MSTLANHRLLSCEVCWRLSCLHTLGSSSRIIEHVLKAPQELINSPHILHFLASRHCQCKRNVKTRTFAKFKERRVYLIHTRAE